MEQRWWANREVMHRLFDSTCTFKDCYPCRASRGWPFDGLDRYDQEALKRNDRRERPPTLRAFLSNGQIANRSPLPDAFT